MRRLIPLLTISMLSVAIAAPVPPEATAEFGTGGVLTPTDLARVKFDSRPVESGKGTESKVIEQDAEEVKRPDAGKERPKNRYDVAVHIPMKRFATGDSVPAYFVLRNNRAGRLSVDARLSLFCPEPVTWNSCRITVRDVQTGHNMPVFDRAGWSCGGGGLLDVPGDGYYCVKGDLGRTSDGKPMPPGQYEVEWRCGALRSAPVTFTVHATDRKHTEVTHRPAYRFCRIRPADEELEESPSPISVFWNDCHLESISAEDMATGLAVGEIALVPDIHTIPAADGLVEASVEWKPYRDGDRVAVTLRAVPPHKRVTFDETPHLYLQLEVPGQEVERGFGEQVKRKDLRNVRITTPLTIEARLPAKWREHSGPTGTARVAVLVAAKEIELPSEARVIRRLQELRLPPGADGSPVWTGVVRTRFTELRFPPPMPVPPAR